MERPKNWKEWAEKLREKKQKEADAKQGKLGGKIDGDN